MQMWMFMWAMVSSAAALAASTGITYTGEANALAPVFEGNRGQAPSGARYLVQAPQFAVLCGDHGCAWHSRDGVLKMEWPGAQRVSPRGIQKLSRRHRYYRGNRQWVAPTFQKVVYTEIYPHIDLELRVDAGEVEYDWVVKPGGAPEAIRTRFVGKDASHIRMDETGSLVSSDGAPTWVHHTPVIYQEVDGQRRQITGHFAKDANGAWGFALGQYNRSQHLVIDPKVSLARKFGGAETEEVNSIAVDGGQVYLVGSIVDLTLIDTGVEPKRDMFVAKVDIATGNVTEPITFIKGNDEDVAYAVAVDSASGAVYVAGTTKSDNFPIPPLTKQPQSVFRKNPLGPSAEDAFIARFDANLKLVNATYFGGDGGDGIRAIKIRGPYIFGVGSSSSSDFRLTNPVSYERGGSQAFIIKIIENASTDWGLAFSSLIGGSGYDKGVALDIDANDNVYIAGETNSNDLSAPVDANLNNIYTYKSYSAGEYCTSGGLDPTIAPSAPCLDAYLIKLSPKSVAEPNNYHIAFTTYLGGRRNETVTSLAVDPQGGGIVIAGSEQSTPLSVTSGLPVPAGDSRLNFFPSLHQPTGITPAQRKNSDYDAYVAMFTANGGELLFSVTLGGSGFDRAEALKLFPHTNGTQNIVDVILVGSTASENFPRKNAVQAFARQNDGFFTRLAYGYVDGPTNASTTLLSSSLFGGTAVEYIYDVAPIDALGKKWVFAGASDSSDLPLTMGSTSYGARDGWLMVWDDTDATQVDLKLSVSASTSTLDKGRPVNYSITVDNANQSGDRVYLWIEFPEEQADYTISILGCAPHETFVSCPLGSAASIPVSLTVTPSFSGDYPVRFGVSGLFADPNYNDNLANVSVNVKSHRQRAAIEIWEIALLLGWSVLYWRRKRLAG